MTDYKKAFVDTAPFIYFIEKNENNPQYYGKVKKFFSNGYEADKEQPSALFGYCLPAPNQLKHKTLSNGLIDFPAGISHRSDFPRR